VFTVPYILTEAPSFSSLLLSVLSVLSCTSHHFFIFLNMDIIIHNPNINSFEYWTSVNGQDIKTIQAYSIGIHIQIVIDIFFSLVFVRNVIRSTGIVLGDIRRIASWCSMISSLSGILFFSIMVIMNQFAYGPSCKTTTLSATIGIAISNFSINAALLERAYVARQRDRKLLVIGLFFNVIQLAAYFSILFIEIEYAYRPSIGCYTIYPKYGPYTRFLVDTLPSLIPSVVFITTIYRQFKRYRRDCWRQLARDGIITMMLIILSNFTSAILLIFKVTGDFSMIVYLIDW
jgi:hypothetical protein